VTYVALLGGYVAAALSLMLLARRTRTLWPDGSFSERPGGWPLSRVLLLMAAVVVIGQMSQAGWLIPSGTGHRVLARLANQLLIFSPVFLAAMFAGRGGTTFARRVAFMPTDRVPTRLGWGLIAAAIALTVHQAIAGRFTRLPGTILALLDPGRSSHALQILGEDLGIGILLASTLTRLRPGVAIVSTGLLFAAGHVPAMLAGSEPLRELARLVADGALAAGMVAVLFRLRDVWSIWPVHVAMDLTQFL
jgi:hypothetical protein